MTDAAIELDLRFDPTVTRAALSLPLTARRKRGQWQMMLLGLLGGGLFGALAIVVLRLGFGLDDALSYLIAAVVGGLVVNAYWQLTAHRTIGQVLHLLKNLDRDEGATKATFDAAGITLASPNAQSHLGWPIITSIDDIKGGTSLLFGASRLVLPDVCLPNGVNGPTFRARVQEWKSAHV